MKTLLVMLLAVAFVFFAGCVGPPELEQFEQIEANETAFVVPLEGSTKTNQGKFMSVEFLEESKVAAKRINIPLRARHTGRFYYQFIWIPTVKVIKVDRTPVTCEWTNDGTTGTSNKNEVLSVESKDSIGFSVGINITCSVLENDAASFLYYYAGKELTSVVNTNIRGRVQEILSREFGKRDLTKCKEEKDKVSSIVCEETKAFFAKKGITVDYLGIVGGLTYEDKEIQEAINKTFIAENGIKVATQLLEAQKKINEKDKEIADTELYVAQRFAEAQDAAIAQIKLDIERVKADAQLEVAKKWDGKLPEKILPSGSPLLMSIGG